MVSSLGSFGLEFALVLHHGEGIPGGESSALSRIEDQIYGQIQ
jgi:hypothetical protein